MSTPEEQKDLWKNCTWKSGEEKLAFFNHYFSKSKIVMDRINNAIKHFRLGVLEFIQEGKFKDKEGNSRPITMEDVINELKEDEDGKER